MPICALPDHLKDKKHNDWCWPFKNIPRGSNAYGPRCPGITCPICHGKGFRPWPPILIKGFGVSRWEGTGEGHSIIHIAKLDDIFVTGDDVYGNVFDGIEMNPALDPGHIVRVKLVRGSGYSPSAIQEFSTHGYEILEPYYVAKWMKWTKTLWPNYRNGYRPDHNDMYYNYSKIVPYAGLHFE